MSKWKVTIKNAIADVETEHETIELALAFYDGARELIELQENNPSYTECYTTAPGERKFQTDHTTIKAIAPAGE